VSLVILAAGILCATLTIIIQFASARSATSAILRSNAYHVRDTSRIKIILKIVSTIFHVMMFSVAAEIMPECVSNSDCTGNYACVNAACINPCNCGLNAKCNVINHYPTCICPPGYSGNPQLGCFKRKYHIYFVFLCKKLLIFI